MGIFDHLQQGRQDGGRLGHLIQYQAGQEPQQNGKLNAQVLPDWRHQNPQQTGIGGLAGNRNLRDLFLKRQGDSFAGGQHPLRSFGGGQHPFTRPLQGGYPRQQPQYDVAGGFEEFGETLGGYKETLGGYGEKLGGFGETLGGYGEQISGFEEQLGGFGEQFSGIEEQVGGVGEDINEINERLGGIEEGISTLSISKPEQKQNPYGNMFNPFSFIGNWGGSRSRMSYR
jgi:hypothetical protein